MGPVQRLERSLDSELVPNTEIDGLLLVCIAYLRALGRHVLLVCRGAKVPEPPWNGHWNKAFPMTVEQTLHLLILLRKTWLEPGRWVRS